MGLVLHVCCASGFTHIQTNRTNRVITAVNFNQTKPAKVNPKIGAEDQETCTQNYWHKSQVAEQNKYIALLTMTLHKFLYKKRDIVTSRHKNRDVRKTD